jgi:PAS domain S-box-containing protein
MLSEALGALDFRDVLDAFADAVVAADATERVVYVNVAAESLFGWPHGHMVGLHLTDLMPERVRAAHLHGFQRYLDTRVPRLLGKPVRVAAMRQDGSEVDVELTISALAVHSAASDSAADAPIFVASFRDLRDRVELERQLSITRYMRAATLTAGELTARLDLGHVLGTVVSALVQRFDAALARVWIYESDTNMLVLRASDGVSRATTTSSRARIDVATHPYKVGDVARRRVPVVKNGLAGEAGFEEAWIVAEKIESVACFPLIVGDDLRGVLVAFFRQPISTDLAELLGTFAAMAAAAMNDVQLFMREQEARADAERARRDAEESESRYRLLAEAIPQMVWTADATGACDYLNQGFLTYSGKTLDELRGDGWQALIRPADRESTRERVARAIESGEAYEAEIELRGHLGAYRWFLSRGQPLRDAAGNVVKWLGTYTDIDQRKRAEDRQRIVIDAGAALVSTLDYAATLGIVARLLVPRVADGCVIDVVEPGGGLRRVVAVDARPEKAVVMKALMQLPMPEHDAPVLRLLALDRPTLAPTATPEALAEGARSPEHLALLQAIAPTSGIIVPLRARGRSIGLLWLYLSDASRAYTGDELGLVEEIASRVGLALDNARLFKEAQDAVVLRDDFLAIASHELKTPLTPLKLQIARLRRDASADVAAKLAVADRQVDRLTRLVNQLLDVSRISGGRLALEPEDMDLAELLRDIATERDAELKRSGSELHLVAPAELRGMWDPLRMDQVITNLLSNAIKYGGGRPIELTLRGDPDGALGQVELVVSDGGIGIDPAHQARIFDRFERAVSTRHFGGFGLGLWIVREIVEASGGRVDVSSALGKGARFRVILPR